MEIKLLNLNFPLNAVSDTPVFDGHRQVASLVEATKLGVGGIVADEKSARFGHFDGLALLHACAGMKSQRRQQLQS